MAILIGLGGVGMNIVWPDWIFLGWLLIIFGFGGVLLVCLFVKWPKKRLLIWFYGIPALTIASVVVYYIVPRDKENKSVKAEKQETVKPVSKPIEQPKINPKLKQKIFSKICKLRMKY